MSYSLGTWSNVGTGTGHAAIGGITGVWGSAANDVWIATGADSERFDGTSWTVCGARCTTASPIRSVWGLASNNIWAVGAAPGGADIGQTVHYDGTSWTLSPGPVQINSIWGTAANNVWAVGGSGAIYRWDGTIWSPVTSPTTQTLFGVWGTASNNVWAVGLAGTIIHYDGTSWTTEPSVATDLLTVWCASATECWAAGVGGNIYKLQVNPAVAHPVLTGLQWDPGDMIVRADDACLGDEVSLSINLEPSLGAGGINWYVINSDTNVVVEAGTSAQFFNVNNKHFHTSRPYPAGEYTFIVTADVSGLLSPDNWAAEAFNVDTGTCFTAQDAENIQSRFDSLDQQVAYINSTTLRTESNVTQVNATVNSAHAHIDAHFVYQNTQFNLTTDMLKAMLRYQNTQLNSTHAHIDAHFVYTNQLFNDTFAGVVFNITVSGGIANETVRLLANEFGLQLGETSTLNILIILAMVVIGVWMYRKKEHDLVVRACGILIVLTAGFIALSTATAWTGGGVFAALVCFTAAGLMFIGFWDYRKERNGKRKKGELDL